MPVFNGTALNDSINGSISDDVVNGNGGDDTINGNAGDDTLNGGDGDDNISDSSGTNVFNGGDGNDRIESGGLNDQIDVGAGDDLVRLSYSIISGVNLSGGSGIDTIGFFNASLSNFSSTNKFEVLESRNYHSLNGTEDSNILDFSGLGLADPNNPNALILSSLGGDDVVNGTVGHDILNGDDGNDILDGEDGNDYLEGGQGGDRLNGGDGDDNISDSSGTNVFNGGAGNDLIQAWGLNDQIDGGVGDDILRLLSADIAGGSLQGGGGIDTIGFVFDTVISSFSTANGFELLDTLNLTINTLQGTDGADILDFSGLGLANPNNVSALVVGANAGNDTVTGTVGHDMIDGGEGNDTLNGDDGNDSLTDNRGTNIFNGGVGNDQIQSGGLNDQIDAGAGDDLVYVYADISGGSLQGGSGADRLVLPPSSRLSAFSSANGFEVLANDLSFNQVLGTDAANILDFSGLAVASSTSSGISVFAQGGNDTVTGTMGNDMLSGDDGNDTLNGSDGDDSLQGGLGNDTYVIDSSGDVVTEGAAAGSDLVEALASFVLGDNIENLTLTGGAALNGTGNAIGNRIIGTAGNNSLDGAAGADTMQGLAGNDSYFVDNVNDRVVETLSLAVGATDDAGGVDTVFASVSYSIDTASNVRFVENLTLTGAANINATGNALANVLTGNAGNNILDGGAGVDVLAGGGGNDLYLLDSAAETVTEGAAAGTDTVRIAASYTLSANVENLELQGSANINGIGNGENNALTGTSGNNRLEGLGGNDVLNGGLGADTMLGGAGDDSYVIENGNDRVFETLTNNAADTNDAGGIDTVSTSITINMNGYNGIRFVERAILTGTGNIGITGNALANHITGNNGNNQLDGGEGSDTLLGGRGNDIYVVDNLGDSISEAGGDGIDVVRSSIDWTLDLAFENLELTGTANLNGTGSALANRLTGNNGNNILDGGGGTDTLIGGAGNDTYIFDSAGDRAVETVTATVTDTNDAGGIDQIFSSFAVNLNQSNGMRFIENVTLTGTAAASVFGNDLANSITANSGANFLDGANGNDIIAGLGGNDTILGGAGADTLDGGAGRDRLTGGAGQDILTGGSEGDTFVFGIGDMGTSHASADRITDWSGLAGGRGDRIDLSAIDANTANGSGTNEAFTFIGGAAFSNVAGQLRSEVISGNTYLMADTNGDGVADLWLRLDGVVTVGVGDLGL